MDIINYHKSTTRELIAVKDRVRNLVNHWGEDGRHQEAVIKSIIKRFIPERYFVSSGFVVKSSSVKNCESSSQIDIIIHDSDFPVLYKEGDFAIVTADSVRAIIEVKANIGNQGVYKIIQKANKVGEFIFNSKEDKSVGLFNGVFSYESEITFNQEKLSGAESSIIRSYDELKVKDFHDKFVVNHISFNSSIFFKFFPMCLDGNNIGYMYQTEELSFSFFISNLVEHLQPKSVVENFKIWFPIDDSFSSKKIISEFDN